MAKDVIIREMGRKKRALFSPFALLATPRLVLSPNQGNRRLSSCASATSVHYNAMSTTIRLELPEEIVRQLESKWKDLPRAALESLVVEAYRSDLVSAEQVRCLLGLATRLQVEEFLKQHEVYDYTVQDLEH
ncbi:MAG: UPF0175 family protein, partial [Deltaproteobacteria bacterium]|nr:UPF0175 family protein [Deltaproteobacteria bacterium]